MAFRAIRGPSYLVEGVPAVVTGLVVLKLLPDHPAEAKWLSAEQRRWLADTIAAESANAPGAHAGGWREAFTDGKVWLLLVAAALIGGGLLALYLARPRARGRSESESGKTGE